jgi:hypothetical protein
MREEGGGVEEEGKEGSKGGKSIWGLDRGGGDIGKGRSA